MFKVCVCIQAFKIVCMVSLDFNLSIKPIVPVGEHVWFQA